MKFSLLALTFFSVLPQYVAPVLAADNVCSTGIYATLAPLAAYAPAQAFCSAKFPAVIVTVTASVYAPRGKRSQVPTTTSNTNAKKSTTTTKPSTTTTTKITTTTKPATTTTTKTTTTTNSQDPKSSLLSLLSAQAYNVASTFCSCINPPKTVSCTHSCALSAAPIVFFLLP